MSTNALFRVVIPFFCMSLPIAAAPQGFDSNKIQENVKADKLAEAFRSIDQGCRPDFDVTKPEDGLTIEDRVSAARNAVECYEKARGLLIATLPADQAWKGKELTQAAIEKQKHDLKVAESENEFLGLSWGVGFGYSFGFGDAIDDAEIVNGVVRVKSDKKQQPRVLLEFHKFFWCNKRKKGTDEPTDGSQGCGPFVALAASQDKVLSGVGMGFMYGRKAKGTDSDGFSIGLGVILDGKVKNLADGFKENEPPPPGETTVRFEEKARWSGLLFVTRTF